MPLEVPKSELLSNVTFVLETGGPPSWLGAPGRLSELLTNVTFALELADPRRGVVPLDVPQPKPSAAPSPAPDTHTHRVGPLTHLLGV